jgi:hypothetical protein
MITLFKHKERDDRGRRNEPKLSKVHGESLVPSSWSSLKTIERPLEEANMVRSSRVDEARRLLVVDSLLKVAVKEGVLHVQLAHGRTT